MTKELPSILNKRVVIEGVTPEIDSGRYPIKRVVGERVVVEADVFTDGHEALSCELRYRQHGANAWEAVPMQPLVNDRWHAEFTVTQLGSYTYTIQAWLDHFKLWAGYLVRRLEVGQDVSIELLIGAGLVDDTLSRITAHKDVANDAVSLADYAEKLRSDPETAIQAALSDELSALMLRNADKDGGITYDRELDVVVEPVRARFGAWYEFFPRSCWEKDCTHGTFKICEDRLPYIKELGFDVVYLPPIHPIGHTRRKGKNNNVVAQADDVGSPWAIGSELGGHKAINPDLGTLQDFTRFVQKAAKLGMQVALDIAFQCSPDHPYVKEHPEWFKMRPDNTIQYAENPPKKYEDIYPFDFDTTHWREMWAELLSIFEYWVGQGITIFRVDNPHTKALRFWQWLIASIKAQHPEVIFLAEAFTRPKVMYYLAKIGFSQSYNYFPWRNSAWELTEYFTELTKTDVKEFFRPNLWPNTPDILHESLQNGGRPAFMSRFVLASTMGASYGIYGPAYELCVNTPIAPGKEEYLDSEKYEIKHWDVGRADSLKTLITRVNKIRHDNPALQSNDNLRFYTTGNEHLLAYSKATNDLSNILLVVVNLDPEATQSGLIELPIEELGINPFAPYLVQDLLTGTYFEWSGSHNYVELNPHVLPAHVLLIRGTK
ncbi:MAG TPA: alpha-1,4-glucan--maltose-1-phosphate maltosyltransferase [Chloroflexia bacterium]|nr:alpha-1,4-glucan--maltose-1-phosphate maltosyltransferase [Chloroflexia bacterium]